MAKQAQWREIVARARTLTELIRGRPGRRTVPTTTVVAERVDAWRSAVAPDPGAFERRLQWDNIELADLPVMLADTPHTGVLPEWATLLRETVPLARMFARRNKLPPLGDASGRQAIPFEEIVEPLVIAARQRLRRNAQFSPKAYADIEHALRTELSSLCALALYADFVVSRSATTTGRAMFGDLLLGHASDGAYRRFVTGLLSDGLRALWLRYPVLARLAGLRTLFWIESNAEFTARLESDRALLAAAFGIAPGDPVASIECNCSDSHRGGRTVSILRFANGTRVVYKPRGLGAERAYGALLAELVKRGLEPALVTPRVVDCETHGWVEHVSPAPVHTVQEVARFYERAGMLTCVTYVLGGGDFHSGNVIARGEHPILIDLEMMMCAPLEPSHPLMRVSASQIQWQLWNSVLRTALIPQWQPGAEGAGIVDGGLTIDDARRCAAVGERWRHVNTDYMAPAVVPMPPAAGVNLPEIDGMVVEIDQQLDALMTGYRRMHALLVRDRETLSAPNGPLHAFRGQLVRVLMRATAVYASAMRRSLHPRYLSSGVRHGIALDALRRAVLASNERPRYWPAYARELASLEQMDFPMFSVRADERMLRCEADLPLGCESASNGHDDALDRLARLDERELARQLGIIRVAVTSFARHRAAARTRDAFDAPPMADTLVEEAVSIARGLAALATNRDDAPSWEGMFESLEPGAGGFRAIDDSLNEGRAGVALFLAAVDHASGRREFGPLAVAAMKPALARLTGRSANAASLGGMTGLGGIGYAALKIATWTNDASVMRGVDDVLALATDERIAGCETLDVYGGVAGLLHALLAIHDATANGAALPRALACGERLLSCRARDARSGLRAWVTNQPTPSTGFAHGASGIAAALARLYRSTGDKRWRDAATEAVLFEQSLFDEGTGNWLDRVGVSSAHDDNGAPRSAWCRGAAGIGLARVWMLDTLPASIVAPDLEAALRTTSRAPIGPLDHLCCGNLGRVELMVTTAARTGRPEFARVAEDLARQLVARARRRGAYSGATDPCFTPHLLQGVAGIGYELLRVAHPGLVPSVLSWE